MGEVLKEYSIKSTTEDEYQMLSSTNNGIELRSRDVYQASNLGYKILEKGDLVISPQNLWLGNININNFDTGLVSPSYKTFKLKDIIGEFLEPILRSPKMLYEYKNASEQGASVVRRNLDLDLFFEIPLQVPSIEEQLEISNFTEKLSLSITLHQRLFFFMNNY